MASIFWDGLLNSWDRTNWCEIDVLLKWPSLTRFGSNVHHYGIGIQQKGYVNSIKICYDTNCTKQVQKSQFLSKKLMVCKERLTENIHSVFLVDRKPYLRACHAQQVYFGWYMRFGKLIHILHTFSYTNFLCRMKCPPGHIIGSYTLNGQQRVNSCATLLSHTMEM